MSLLHRAELKDDDDVCFIHHPIEDEEHLFLAATLNAISDVMKAQGKLDEAPNFRVRATAIIQKLYSN